MKNKNLHCTGQAYVKQLLKRLVYGTPIRCVQASKVEHSIPEYPIVYQRETKPAVPDIEWQEVVF